MALRNQSIAIGADSLALGDQSTALGANSRATGAASVAIGGDDIDSARGNNAVYKALTGVDLPSGYISTQSSGDASTAVGVQAKASGHYGTAIGMASAATGNLSVGIGSKATASSDATTAIGVNSSASKKYASAIGLNSTASGEYATSIGSGGNTVSKATQATADGALALGGNANAGAQASNINATAIGGESVASGVSAIALGTQAEALATNSLAFGRKAQVTNTNATGAMAIGSQLDWAFDAADGGTQTVNTKADGRNSLALGNGAQSNSENSMALGNVANATGNQAIALGTYNKANGLSSLSIGHRSNANADYALAQGYKALASGVSSISVGNQANALATNTVAIGRGASSKFNDNIAIGTNAVADTGSNTIGSSIAMGANAYTLGMYQTAVGTGARATTNQAAALGYKAGAAGSGSAAVGTGTASLGTGSTVVSAGAASNDLKGLAAGVPMGSGFRSVTMSTAYTGPTQTSIAGSFSNNSRLPTNFTFTLDGTTGAVTGGTLGTKTLNKEQALAVYNALSMGSAIATEDNSTAVGYSSLASGAAATALGGGASALGANAVAVGRAEGVGANAVAVGYASQALGSESTAVGKNTVASASNTLAIGSGGTDANSTKTTASAVGAIAIGGNTTAGARALGTDSIALGGESIAGSTSKANAVAIGKGAKATGQNAISIGTGNTVSGDNSGAIGDPTTITGSGTYTVGNNNGTVDASESGIMGNNNTITTGLGITDTRVIGNKNTINSTKVMVLGNGVTVGANLDGAVVLGDGSTVTSATPTANATVTGTAANAKAINYGTFAGATPDTGDVVSVGAVGNERQIINVAAGEIASGSTDAINGSQLYATQAVISNLAGSTAAALGGGASVNSANGAILAPTYSLTNNPNAGTKTTSNNVGGALTTLDTAVNQPITFKDAATGTSVQKLGSTFAIVGDGKNLSTVVTAGQAKISMSDTPIFTNVTADQVTVKNAPTAGTDATNKTYVDGQVQSVANNPLTFAGDTGTNVQRKLGETTKIVGGITDPTKLSANNIGVVADGTDKLTIQLAKDLTGLNSVESNTIKLGDAINNTTLTSTANGLNVGGDKITNVGKGDVSATSTDAINGSQLNTAQNSTSSIIGGGVTNNAGSLTGPFTTNGNSYSNIAEAIEDQAKKSKTTVTQGDNIVVTSGTNADGSVNYEVATAKDVNFDKVTVGNVVTDGATGKISGLTAGDVSSTSTEAINGSQLNAQGEGVKNIIGGSTVYDPTTGTLTNTNIGGTGESTIDDAIKNVNTAATKAKTTVTQGDNIVVTSGTNADGSVNYEVATAKDVNFDKVTVGNVVTDGATGKISGLTDGTVAAGSTEAVTGNQLNAQGEGVKNIIGGSTVYDPTTGTLTNTNIGGTGESTIDDAIKNVNTAATKAKTTVTQGDNIVVTSGTNADGSVNYEVATAKDVNFDSVTVGKGADTTILTSTEDGLDVGGDKITNVGAGKIATGSTDAVTGDQLNKAADNLTTILGGNATNVGGNVTTSNIGGTGKNTINDAISSVNTAATKAKTTVTEGDNITITSSTNADGSTNYEVATAKDVKFDNLSVGPITVSKNGIDAGNTQIKNIAAGTAAGDAVNVSQLNDVVNNKIQNDVTSIIGTTDGQPSELFETYNVSGQSTTDRRNILETVTSINTKGAKYFHTNAVDESVEAGVVGETNDSSAGGKNSTAIGVNAIVAAGATSTAALGHNTLATDEATNAVVVGSGSKVGGASTIAIGHNAQALGQQSISIGTGNIVTGNNSGALGDPSILDGNSSYSVGNNNKVATDNTFVLGNDVTQTVDGSVVLGNKSAATTGAGVGGYTLAQATTADRDAITQTTSTTGAVAVGDATNGVYRQITGVAAGTADSDAVNVAQLKAVDHQVTTTQGALVDSLGGGSKVNQDGTITGPTYNVGGGTQTNVGDALDALNTKVNNVDTTANAGWTVKAGDQSQTIKPKATVEFVGDDNITVTQENDKEGNAKLAVELNKKLDVEQLKAGDTVINHGGVSIGQVVQLGGTGLIIQNGPSVTTTGINAGNKVISNVAAGQKDSDAVNKGQLDSAISNITNQVDQANNSSVQYDKKADGSVNKDSVTLGGGSNGTTLTNVAEGKVQEGSKDAVNGGQLWSVEQKVNQNTSDINNIKNEINNGSLGLVQQTGGSKADITVGKNTGGTTVNMAGKDGDRIVTGVADGAVNKDSKDAINGSQLHAQKVETNQKVVEYLGGGAAIDNIIGSFTTAPSYTVGDSKYNNVGGAIDALNKADQELGNKINNVSNRLEQAFQSTNQRIDDVEKRANAGIAAAMALENAPYIPGKYTYAAGASYHGGESAIGVTLRKTADNGRWSLTGGIAAASEGDPSVRIGISGVID